MKQLLYLFSLYMFFGCTTKIEEEDIKHLNGYWEIEQVTFSNGETKNFKVNPTIDYIELKGLEGFRKKVYPKFDGTFETSDDAEYFIVARIDSKIEMRYKPGITLDTKMFSRIESLIQLSANQFSVVNSDTITYSYKRFEPIVITE